ncbi:MAG TPA: 4Fe-4S binding protein [Vicinamibacterales bacterium]|nr:4Fe-4S binding protein [Vicinamibacterales bacterium]
MKSYSKLPVLRRISQVAFFAAFLFLLLRTEFTGSFRGATGDTRLRWPVSIFLEADPLAGITTALSTGTLYRGLLWSLVILLPTFFLGRFFCGWICPLGTLNHFFGNLRSEKKRGKALLESNRYKRWYATKYYVLAAVLVAAVFGSLIAGFVDPIPLLVRSLALSILPGINYATGSLIDALYESPFAPVRFVADALQVAFQGSLATFKQPHFRQGIFIGLIFVGLLALNLRVTRFWCRAVCPLGALLGVASRWSLLHLKKDESRCDQCNRCLMRCQGGDDPLPGTAWRKAECHLCFNCVGQCPTSGLEFGFGRPPAPGAMTEVPQLQRRRLLTGVVAGAALVPLMRSTTGFAVEADPRLIRPPGALDEPHFLERCIRCGACMKVCPNNALHPTFLEGGLEAMWTPVIVPRVGYCEPNCVLCSTVCPTGAIWELSVAEKLGRPAGATAASEPAPAEGNPAGPGPVKIGTAFYDQGRCLPWAMATDCIVCEEWCPTSPKAIFLVETEVVDAEANTKTVRRPFVDAKRCIGCGACEYACPVKDRPAVYITSVGETRSKTNQFILPAAPRRG